MRPQNIPAGGSREDTGAGEKKTTASGAARLLTSLTRPIPAVVFLVAFAAVYLLAVWTPIGQNASPGRHRSFSGDVPKRAVRPGPGHGGQSLIAPPPPGAFSALGRRFASAGTPTWSQPVRQVCGGDTANGSLPLRGRAAQPQHVTGPGHRHEQLTAQQLFPFACRFGRLCHAGVGAR